MNPSRVLNNISRRPVGLGGSLGNGFLCTDLQTINFNRRILSKPDRDKQLHISTTSGVDCSELDLPSTGNEVLRAVAAQLHADKPQTRRSYGATCSAEGQGQTQTIKNESAIANKAPLQSKEKSPKIDDGAGGFPPRDDGGGGGGGGGGGWGGGGFVFWALLLLVGFLRDRELDKPYNVKKPRKQKRRAMT